MLEFSLHDFNSLFIKNTNESKKGHVHACLNQILWLLLLSIMFVRFSHVRYNWFFSFLLPQFSIYSMLMTFKFSVLGFCKKCYCKHFCMCTCTYFCRIRISVPWNVCIFTSYRHWEPFHSRCSKLYSHQPFMRTLIYSSSLNLGCIPTINILKCNSVC